MITLLGALLGLFGSLAPELVKLFQDKRDKAHEVDILKLQASEGANLREYDAKMFAAQADMAFYTAEQDRIANQQANDKTGIQFVDAANALVRPVIAYAFFALYAFIKVYIIMSVGMDTVLSTPWVVWSEEDAGIFAAIISFYYGSRALKRTMGRG